MSDSSALPKSCPKCGAALPSEATDGLCPNCLMNEAMQPTQVSDAAKPKPSGILAPEALAPFFPQYEILRMLGRGGMGAVYLARQILLNRLVAIKILTADADDNDQGFAERFKHEARAMAQLSHPGIVGVYDFGQTANGLLYIVMEFIEGTDVQLMLVSQGRLRSAHAMAITAHVCDALQYAHSRGIIHRDIKPSNIMVGNDGVVKVADFGLAKMSQGQTTGLTQSGTAMGTLHFMAPEALTLGSSVDQRADIYAVGVMLYQMLTGKLPQGLFEMPSYQVPGLDPRYDRIVAKALREDREVRYQAAAELRHDLDAILTQPVETVAEGAGEVKALPPVAARGKKNAHVPSLPPPQAVSPEPARKKPVGLILTALVLGAAALAVAFVYFRDHGVGVHGQTSGATTSQPELATKDAPFINTLGMKFVPVPGTNILMCIHETRRKDYAAYADANVEVDGTWRHSNENGISVGGGDDHPVAAVSWQDARGFCAWLSHKEGRTYRLPSDREWSLAVGIADREEMGASPESLDNKVKNSYPWGNEWPPPHGAGNFCDETAKAAQVSHANLCLDGYTDGHATTASVMSFQPNLLGIYDLAGNLWEWCSDWYGADQTSRVLRGGSWLNGDNSTLLSSERGSFGKPSNRNYNLGFRCVLESGGDAEASARLPSKDDATSIMATQEQPFINTLGMQFVPVLGTDVLMCIHETRSKDYAAYAKEVPNVDGSWQRRTISNYTPTDRIEEHPVMNVSWEDAKAFCDWLSKKEGVTCRLPTDREWSFAVGIGQDEKWENGTTPATVFKNPTEFPWGRQRPPSNGAGNYSDQSRKRLALAGQEAEYIEGYDDGFPLTAPVMSFQPNKLGIYDLGGNVFEFCEDWFDSSAKQRVARGASWYHDDRLSGSQLLSSARHPFPPGVRNGGSGFRVVIVLPKTTALPPAPPLPTPTAANLSAATKDAPFVNTLGMKFVPVPITGGASGGQRVLFSIWETRVQDYEVFAKETKREWPKPDFEQGPAHPAVMVNPEDATSFCAWLTERERKSGGIGATQAYRLPLDHEWSCAVGIGDREDPARMPMEKRVGLADIFPWGKAWPPPPGAGNYNGEEAAGHGVKLPQPILTGYQDGSPFTAPVGSFAANPTGLFDLGGNVWEWCEDVSGSPAANRPHVMRGAAFDRSNQTDLASAFRLSAPSFHSSDVGFRIVLVDGTGSSAEHVGISSLTATKEAPFVNTLGMKFLPVPGTKVLFCIHETRKKDYAQYAAQDRSSDDRWKSASFEGLPVGDGDDHPVAMVAWTDAAAFCVWLSKKEGKRYRLPTDREWSIAVGLGGREPEDESPDSLNDKVTGWYPWGNLWPPPQGEGNFLDVTASQKISSRLFIQGCTDGFVTTAPVMSFRANQLGLFDLGGNVWEWCGDWYDTTRSDRVLRGGSWIHGTPDYLLASHRYHDKPGQRRHDFGFRCVLDGPVAEQTSAQPGANDSNSGLVSWWKGDDDARDSVGTNHGTVRGGVSFADGLFGKAFLLKGGSVEIPDSPSLQFAPDSHVTMSLWANRTKPGSVFHIFGKRLDRNHDGISNYQLGVDSSIPSTPLNEWVFWTVVNNGDYSSFYINGQWARNLPKFGPVNTVPLIIGGSADFYRFEGLIDDFRIYNRAMSAEEIRALFEAQKAIAVAANPRAKISSGSAAPQAGGATPTTATKDAPFINILGMKFVPVPITGGAEVLFSVWVTRVKDFAAFVDATGYDATQDKESRVIEGDGKVSWKAVGKCWKDPGFPQTPEHPAVAIGWDDARAFCTWLTQSEQRTGNLPSGWLYRLPLDHEWSCAVGMGDLEDPKILPAEKSRRIENIYPWGVQWPPPAGAGNYAGLESKDAMPGNSYIEGYNDGIVWTSPVASYAANQFGLYDMGGNITQFCEDTIDDKRTSHVLRGAACVDSLRRGLLSSARYNLSGNRAWTTMGFRCVLAPAPGQVSTARPAVTTTLAVVRTFTSSAGTTLRGELVSVKEDIVTIKKEDGQSLTLKMSAFSPADQTWLQSQAGPAPAVADPTQATLSTSAIVSKSAKPLPYADRIKSIVWAGDNFEPRYMGELKLRETPIGWIRNRNVGGLAFHPDGRIAFGTGSGTTADMALSYWEKNSSIPKPVVALEYRKYTADKVRDAEEAAGRFWFFTGQLAFDRTGSCYFTLGAGSPDGLYKVLSASPVKIEKLRPAGGIVSLQIPYFDATHFYVTMSNSIFLVGQEQASSWEAGIGDPWFSLFGKDVKMRRTIAVSPEQLMIQLEFKNPETGQGSNKSTSVWKTLVFDRHAKAYWSTPIEGLGPFAVSWDGGKCIRFDDSTQAIIEFSLPHP